MWNRELDIYGRCIKGNSDFVPFLYQGQYYDKETQLAYNRFRYYDPKMGMYISQDPIGLMGGMVLYGYVGDVNGWLDVLGLAKRSPVNEFDLGGFEKLSLGIKGDGLDSHELLQSVWLRENHQIGRGKQSMGKENPSIALKKTDIHTKITALQNKYGMKGAKLRGQSALQNINRNTALTRRGIYEGLVSRGVDKITTKKQATELAMKLRENAIDFGK